MSYCAKLQSKPREKTAEEEGNASSDVLEGASISQLAANVSKLYDSFVSSSSQNIPGNIQKEENNCRPTKIQKIESNPQQTETTSEATERGASKVAVDEKNENEFSDSDDGNIMF